MSKKLSTLNVILVLLSIIMCIVFGVEHFINEDYLMVFTSVIIMFLPLMIYVIDKFIKTGIPETIKTAYLTFLFASAILGAIGGFYEKIHLYDKIVHFSSGLLISWVFAIWYERINKKYDIKNMIFSLTCFNATIALLWEIFEYTMDLLFNRQVQKGLSDTMTDMIVAVIGGILISLVYIDKFMRKEPKNKKAIKM